MTSLVRRIVATFMEPVERSPHPTTAAPGSPDSHDGAADAPPPRPAVVFTPPRSPRGDGSSPARVVAPPHPAGAPGAPPVASPTTPPSRTRPSPATPAAVDQPAPLVRPAITDAIVLAADAAAVPVGAACAGELRARARTGAALLCVWHPTAEPADELELWDDDRPPSTPTGATTPAARRLAVRLAAHGLEATARGRLAWLRLEPEPSEAAAQARRCLAIAGAPVVIALAGPRDEALESLIAEVGLVLAVLPAGADPALRELVSAGLPNTGSSIIAPLRAGPPRWAAMAGLGRLRSLGAEDA